MTDRFDLEQQIIGCWNVTDDLRLMSKMEATPENFHALAEVYEYKFKQQWDTFETMCAEHQFHNPITPGRITAACYARRHDYGLLPLDERQKMYNEAKEWIEAFGFPVKEV